MYIKGYILIALILLASFSCAKKKETTLTFSREIVDSLMNLEKKCINKKKRIISFTDTIEFSDEKDQIFFEKDTITYKTNSKGRKELISFNNEVLMKYRVKNSKYIIDSMELVIDLNELDICYLKDKPNIIIIKTKPMNWVGRMTRLSFFQLINSKEKTVVEFIREDEDSQMDLK